MDSPYPTACAYGPDKPDPDTGYRNPTDADVIVIGNLDVADEQLVAVQIQTGRGDWADKAGHVIEVRRIQLAHIRRPGYNARARLAARLAMSSLAERMVPNYGPKLRQIDPVAYWDARTSMDDQRAALCLAVGIDVNKISRDGYDLSRPGSRAAWEATRP